VVFAAALILVGAPIDASYRRSTQGISRLSTGNSVPISYAWANPERARIDSLSFSHRWMMGAAPVAFAIGIGALTRRNPAGE
jgi:hypothetical protein